MFRKAYIMEEDLIMAKIVLSHPKDNILLKP